MSIFRIGGVPVCVGFRESFEGVGDPHATIRHSVSLEDPAHEDCCATSPDPCLDQVARNIFVENALGAVLDVVHSLEPDHRLCSGRPVAADLPDLRILRSFANELHTDRGEGIADNRGRTSLPPPLVAVGEPEDVVVVLGQHTCQRSFQQIEIKGHGIGRGSWCRGHDGMMGNGTDWPVVGQADPGGGVARWCVRL